MENSIKLQATRDEFADFIEREDKYDFIFKYYEVERQDLEKFRDKSYKGNITFDVLVRHSEDTRLVNNKTYTFESMIEALEKKHSPKTPTVKELEILRVTKQDITYPLYGNKHSMPYGNLLIENLSGERKWCRIKEDSFRQFITFNRKRYYVHDIGRYMSANFEIDKNATTSYYENKGFQVEWI